LKKTGISYHDEGSYIILKKKKTTITKALTVKNLFLLNIITSTILAVKKKPTLFRGITKKKDFWHRRLCHAEHTRIQAATNITTGIDLKTPEQGNKKDADCLVYPDELNNGVINDLNAYDSTDYVYKLYALNKQTRVIYYNFIRPIISKLERVYTDLWGFYDPASFAGNSYAAVLINDFTRKSWVKFLKTKNQYFDKFKT